MTVVAGMDGCAAGWLCLWFDEATGRLAGRLLGGLDELSGLTPSPVVVGADIPIGLPESGPRPCDREARRRLGRSRGSSVFPAPIRPMLGAATYEQACARGERADGRRLSRQAWNLLPKIREMDDFLAAGSGRRGWIREVHPELSFAAWNGGVPMGHNKKTAAGREERRALAAAGFGSGWEAVQAGLPATGYGEDDVLDALAVLWSARRIAAGRARRLPEAPERDARGLPMEIVF
jgi:predicted RNase H-like nuclease